MNWGCDLFGYGFSCRSDDIISISFLLVMSTHFNDTFSITFKKNMMYLDVLKNLPCAILRFGLFFNCF